MKSFLLFLSAILCSTLVFAQQNVFISEVLYDDTATNDVEWVEIFNGNPFPIDLTNWILTDGNVFPPPSTEGALQVPPGIMLQPHQFLVLSRNPIPEFPGEIVCPEIDPSWILNNSGDNLALYDQAGQLVDGSLIVTYPDLATGNQGNSIEKCDVFSPWSGDSSAWHESDIVFSPVGRYRHCTPGAANSPCAPNLCATVTAVSCDTILTNQSTTGGTDLVEDYLVSDWTEDGPERVYRVDLLVNQTLTATLSNTNTDLDVFLLADCDPDSTVAYGNQTASWRADITGPHYVVVDGYLGAEGSYDLILQCSMDPPPSLFDPSLHTHLYFDGQEAGPTKLLLSPPEGTFMDRCTFINKGMPGDLVSIHDSAGTWNSGPMTAGQEFLLPITGTGRISWVASTPLGLFNGVVIVPGCDSAMAAPEALTILRDQNNLVLSWSPGAGSAPDYWTVYSSLTADGPFTQVEGYSAVPSWSQPIPADLRKFYRVTGTCDAGNFFSYFNGTLDGVGPVMDPDSGAFELQEWHWAEDPSGEFGAVISQLIGRRLLPASPGDSIITWDTRAVLDSLGWEEIYDLTNVHVDSLVAIPEVTLGRIAFAADAANIMVVYAWSAHVTGYPGNFFHAPDAGACRLIRAECHRVERHFCLSSWCCCPDTPCNEWVPPCPVCSTFGSCGAVKVPECVPGCPPEKPRCREKGKINPRCRCKA